MNKALISLLGIVFLAGIGCNNGTPGGPGASKPNGKPIVGEADDSFRLDMPPMSTSIKQGETKAVTLGIKRGKNFHQDVHLTFSDVPKGLTIAPANPIIKQDDSQVKLTIKAADDAALGDFVLKTGGHPTQGPDAKAELKISVAKK